MCTTKRIELSRIFSMAWQMVKSYGMSISEALRKSWQLSTLKKAMCKGIVKFTFLKTDGSTLREAYGTLCENIIPQTGESKRKPCASVFTYYDTEKMSFRCFRIANLVKIG